MHWCSCSLQGTSAALTETIAVQEEFWPEPMENNLQTIVDMHIHTSWLMGRQPTAGAEKEILHARLECACAGRNVAPADLMAGVIRLAQ